MAKLTVTTLSKLGKHSRWDAKFHIALAQIKESLEPLKSKVSRNQATEILSDLPPHELVDVLRLSRATHELTIAETLKVTIAEYPLESLGLVLTSESGKKLIMERLAELSKESEELKSKVKLLKSVLKLPIGN